jgi:glycosyltransferase involved in cell wall biosynthesis
VLERLRSGFGLDVELSVIGGEPPSSGNDWYRRVPIPTGCSPYPRFVEWLRSEGGRWDAAVGPLLDTPFNASKSDLKFLEYSALGLPGVYSDVPAFSTVEDGVSGLLAANTVESWASALARLCGDVALQGRLREAAQNYVFTERCIAHTAGDYLDLLCGALVDPEAARAAGERLAQGVPQRSATVAAA